MKQKASVKELSVKLKQVFFILAGLFAIPAWVMAQPLPTMPPANYEQVGVYPAGAINTITYYSSVYGTNEQMMVYTPPGYSTSQKYPVVYGYQGIGAGIDTIFDNWCCDAGNIADNLIGQRKIQPVIIVAVNDQINGDPTADTLNCVIPYIDSNYSTDADADHRGLYGYSWGGMYTADVGCANLSTFHNISPSSPAFFSSGQGPGLFPNGGAQAKQVLKCLLLSCGTSDWDGFYPASQDLHDYCVSNNIPHGWLPVLGEGHDGGVWAPAMWNFLQMADAAGFRYPPRSRSAYSQVAAVSYDIQAGGVVPETCSDTGGGQDVGTIQNGYYLAYNNVDFATGATNFQARVASATSGGNIELHLDSTNGTLVGTCSVPDTGGWQTWTTITNTVSGATGIHNVYLVFTGGSGYLFNVEWWQFNCTNLPALPLAPAGLVATAGIERVSLRWTAITNATSYNVKRATTSGGTYTNIANVAGTNYTDAGVIGGATVIGGTTYYYKVSALNVGGESTNSAPASVTPTVNVPSPWLTRDIGAGGLAGGTSFTNGIFTVIGCGADIWDPADQFRFVHLTNSGDCTIIARVTSASVEDINPWSKAGVMIRESFATNAANALIAVTPGNGVVFQYRSSTGGGSISNNVTGLSAPCWVKLVRSGNTFTGYCSSDGSSWTQVGSATVTMATTAYVGLAVTSHDAYTLSTATFDRVTGPGWAPPVALTPAGLVATAGTEQVALKWTASSNATSYYVKRASTVGGSYTNIANVATTNYTDTRLVGRTKYYYVVSAVNSLAGESVNSAPVNATPTVNVPLPWMTQDIGVNGLWGSAGVTNGVFTITGSGDDIWNSADTFRFVYLTNSSDCTIVARVVSVQNSDGWAKAGIMARDSLDPGAANALIALTPGNGATWQYRSSDGGGCNSTTTSASAPYWVKLVCSGSTFTGCCSPDGTNWTQLGSTTLTNIAYIGLAVTAHNNSSLCTATFDNVSLPGWPPPLLMADAVAASSSRVSVTWNNLTNATSYNVKRSSTSGGPYTTIASGLTATNYSDIVASVRAGYYYVVSAMIGGSETNSPEAAVRFLKLTGGIIGTAGSWGGSGNTITNVFDGDLTTYFDGPDGNGDWVGLDFGAGVSNVIVQINYCPRSGWESRMTNGIFQGANQADFSDAVTLFTVTNQPATGVFTSASITNTAGFRYARYLSPDNGFGNMAEVEFYGYPVSTSVPVTPTPGGLTATTVSSSQINLVWNGLTNATSYNVKRSTTNGGPYSIIAPILTTTNYQDTGLNGGTMYYYVVSAIVSGGETTNSAQAGAATLSPTLGSLVHRYSFGETNGSTVADSVGGPVWAGTLPNGGTLAGGQLALSSGSSQYVRLPAGVVASMSNITVMAWINLTSVSYWSRIFDFGNNTTSYMFLTPRNGFDYTARFGISTSDSGGERDINCPMAMGISAWHQVVVTLNSGTGILYVDGLAVGTNASMSINPSSLGSTVNNYIGRSQSGSEPYLDGSIDEFRIYNVALAPVEIAASAAMGPSQLLSPNSPAMSMALTGTNLTVSWPVASAGFTLQSRTNLTLGDWMNVTLSAPQIIGSQWQVALPPPGDAIPAFYRLVK
jgi:enterochelin esterase-like enzyme/fibronectin type 3 domain-containing protein